MILENWLSITTLVFIKYSEICSIMHTKVPANEIHHTQLNYNTTINKVILTQRGYIQFLKYYIEVPPLTEYTFCLWINSANLTHSHPLLSYSKHEEERLIRVWITPGGHNIKTEILSIPIFSIPINLIENHWYHICQSWSSYTAIWNVFLNGLLLSQGQSPELKGQIIKGDGDIVVGQEYTDFDKGLEDGIEGAIYGFNFVLSQTAHLLELEDSHSQYHNPLKLYHQKRQKRGKGKSELLPPATSYGVPIGAITEIPKQEVKPRVAKSKLVEPNNYIQRNFKTLKTQLQNDIAVAQKRIFFEDEPNAARGFPGPHRTLKESKYKIPLEGSDIIEGNGKLILRGPKLILNSSKDQFYHIFEDNPVKFNDQYLPVEVAKFGHNQMKKSLGLSLVELSRDCNFRKGAPLEGPKVLINWAKTTVRVFGGAILKSIPPFCK